MCGQWLELKAHFEITSESVKNKLRNKINTDTENAILHIRYGLKRMGETCSTHEFQSDVLESVTSNLQYQSRVASPDKTPATLSGCSYMSDEDAGRGISLFSICKCTVLISCYTLNLLLISKRSDMYYLCI